MLALVVLIVAALVAPVAARSSAAGDADRARPVVLAGDAVPGGGTFERFSVESLPIVAPVTSEGRVAFFATILRGRASEGFFVWSEGKVAKVVVDGDPSPAGGTFSGFGRHPIPALNAHGRLAFAAAVAGGKTVEGIFLATGRTVKTVAVTGGAAPGVPSGVRASVDAPSLNDRGGVAFLATVRRGRESLVAVFVAALGDAAPGGGVLSYLRPWPALTEPGTVGFVASVDHGPAPIGVFTADRSETRKIAGVGDTVVGVGRLASFGLYPTMAISATRAVTVAIARDGGGAGVDGIVLVPPPP